MDLTQSVSGNFRLRVVGLKADGTAGSFAAPPTFTVESGSVTLAPGPDENSNEVAVDNTVANNATIRVDANADLHGGERIVSAKLFVSISPAGIPSDEVVDLQLQVE